MKRTILVFLTSLMLAGCNTAFDATLLQPAASGVVPLLPRLDIQKNADEQLYKAAYVNTVSANSYFYTVFEREVEQNICEQFGEKKGIIEMRVVALDENTSIGLVVFSTCTCGLFNLLGSPTNISKMYLECDFSIYDSKGEKIWRKSYSASDKLVQGLYYNWGNANNRRIKLLHENMESFKKDLTSDSQKIREELFN